MKREESPSTIKDKTNKASHGGPSTSKGGHLSGRVGNGNTREDSEEESDQNPPKVSLMGVGLL